MTSLLYATCISVFILSLFYYWFVVANRYLIFLYFHLGANPFDFDTSSRYWMAGLVAAGLVLLLYTAVNWFLGRLANWRNSTYSSPVWWRVWLWCLLPLATGIPFITMRFNMPTLPLNLALAATVVTLAGLALALLPGEWAAERPSELIWLTLDGLALLPLLTLLPALETSIVKPEVVSLPVGFLVTISTLVVSLVWLGVMTGLRKWRGKPTPSAPSVFIAGLILSYLLMPVLHYVFRGYITLSANFFALTVWVQIVVWLVTAALIFLATKLRQRILD